MNNQGNAVINAALFTFVGIALYQLSPASTAHLAQVVPVDTGEVPLPDAAQQQPLDKEPVPTAKPEPVIGQEPDNALPSPQNRDIDTPPMPLPSPQIPPKRQPEVPSKMPPMPGKATPYSPAPGPASVAVPYAIPQSVPYSVPEPQLRLRIGVPGVGVAAYDESLFLRLGRMRFPRGTYPGGLFGRMRDRAAERRERRLMGFMEVMGRL